MERFVTQHLPSCRCPAPCQRTEAGMRAALAHLLRLLRASHCIAGPPLGPPAIHAELERFDAHLDSVGGVAPATRISCRMWVRKFLLDRLGDGPVSVGWLKPGDIADFLGTHCNGYRPGTARVLGCSLRSYLRFRALHCGDPVEPPGAPDPTAQRQRTDRGRLPRQLPAAAPVCSATSRQEPATPRSHGSGWAFGARLPEPSRGRAPRHDSQPQCAVCGDSLVPTVRGPQGTGGAAGPPARAGDPDEALRQGLLGFLSPSEVQAVLEAPDQATWSGRRDRVLLATLLTARPAARQECGWSDAYSSPAILVSLSPPSGRRLPVSQQSGKRKSVTNAL